MALLRRVVLSSLLIGSVVLFGVPGLGAAGSGRAALAGSKQPNVLVIVVDDQRDAGTIKVMRNLRRLVIRQGVRFSNAYATTPLCCPARASIMTGQYAHNHGVGTNRQVLDLDHSTTMQRYLSDAGYRTGLVGKFLNGYPLGEAPPYFDDYSVLQRGYYDTTWNVDGEIREVSAYSTHFVARRARRFIEDAEQDDDRPWLLYATPYAPHRRPIPQPRYAGAPVGKLEINPAMSETDCSDKPAFVDCRANLPYLNRLRAQMLRTLLSVDDLVGKLDRALVEAGESRRTLLFFLSDNGYFWGEHGLAGKGPPYRGGIEIPMMMRWPGHTEPGIIDERLVANIDIAATVYAAAGVTPGVEVDGRDLLFEDWSRSRLLVEIERTDSVPVWASNISPDHQYIEYYEQGSIPSFREYYDLITDPWQLTNLLNDGDPTNDPSLEEQIQFKETLDQDRQCVGSACP